MFSLPDLKTLWKNCVIICKSVVIQGLSTKSQWSADGFFYQGTFSPSLTQQIGGEGSLEKLRQDTRTAWIQLCRMQFWHEYCTYKQVGSYEDSTGAGAELPHDHVSSVLLHVAMLKKKGKWKKNKNQTAKWTTQRKSPRSIKLAEKKTEKCTIAETVKSLCSNFSVSQSTFLLVLTKMTAWVMVRVSYRSHSVSSFHSWRPEPEHLPVWAMWSRVRRISFFIWASTIYMLIFTEVTGHRSNSLHFCWNNHFFFYHSMIKS